jgi:DNA ligase-1
MLLEQLIGSLQGAPQLRLSPLIAADSWERLAQIRARVA